MKKNLSWGEILVIAYLMVPGFQKMLVINPLQALVHPQTQKKTVRHGLSIPNLNFSEFPFWINRSAD
jgi:hypothetical protein